MDESLPATSTPVDEPEQDGTVAHDAKAARERRRLRVPTSVLVTFVGIALTAWLLPALTHQWDDRQNSQELKAAIVADIATATAQALVGGEAIWAKPPRPVNRAKLADDWSRASLRIEARLRAYFGPPIIAAWQIYTWFVDRFVDGRRGQARAALLAASRSLSGNPLVGGGLVDLDPGAAYALAGVLSIDDARLVACSCPSFETKGWQEESAFSSIVGYVGPQVREYGRLSGPRTMQAALVSYQQELTRELLAAHASGYSTTSRDLLNDLLPF